MTRRPIQGVIFALALWALCGCGWRAGLGTHFPPGSTAAVAFLGNDSRVADLEVQVTRALSDALLERSGLAIAHPGDADFLVRGRVLDYRRRGGVRTPENEQLETGVELSVRVELVRRSDGMVLSRAERQLAAGFALDGRGLAIDAAPERAQVDRALTYLAEGLILDLLGPAAYKGVQSGARDAESAQ